MKLIIFSFLILLSSECFAKKISLVIGNSDYTTFAFLDNPVNDASGIVKALAKVGYTNSILLKNVKTRREMRKAIDSVMDMLRPGDEFVFYYSGHAIESNGINYLAPTNSKTTEEFFGINYLLDSLRDKETVNILILDACANDAEGNALDLSIGLMFPENTFFVSSAGTGELAAEYGGLEADDTGTHTVFARSLIREMVKADLSVNKIFDNVREEVARITGGQQIPSSNSNVLGILYFEKGAILPY